MIACLLYWLMTFSSGNSHKSLALRGRLFMFPFSFFFLGLFGGFVIVAPRKTMQARDGELYFKMKIYTMVHTQDWPRWTFVAPPHYDRVKFLPRHRMVLTGTSTNITLKAWSVAAFHLITNTIVQSALFWQWVTYFLPPSLTARWVTWLNACYMLERNRTSHIW